MDTGDAVELRADDGRRSERACDSDFAAALGNAIGQQSVKAAPQSTKKAAPEKDRPERLREESMKLTVAAVPSSVVAIVVLLAMLTFGRAEAMPAVVGVAAISLAQRVASSRVAEALPAATVAFAIAMGVVVVGMVLPLLCVEAAGRRKAVSAALGERERYACSEHKGDQKTLD